MSQPPESTTTDLAIGRAALDFATATAAVRDHDGPKSGPEFEAKVAQWRRAFEDLLRLAAQQPQREEPAE